MLTVFERVPDEFVRLYDDQLQAWARNFRRVGKVGTIRLQKPVAASLIGEKASLDRYRIVGVRLKAEVDKDRVVVSPQTDEDAEVIAAHLFDMAVHYRSAALH